ncbi:hypothetical protein FRC07_007526 [Ceratobasidium sp. 392]|nr:hypothetical protein FRC07_007526 [Ceratobasidium sp. 392]
MTTKQVKRFRPNSTTTTAISNNLRLSITPPGGIRELSTTSERPSLNGMTALSSESSVSSGSPRTPASARSSPRVAPYAQPKSASDDEPFEVLLDSWPNSSVLGANPGGLENGQAQSTKVTVSVERAAFTVTSNKPSPDLACTPTSPSGPDYLTRHPKYYFLDGSLRCQTENTLYRIHRHIGQLSPSFMNQFLRGKDARPWDERSKYSYPTILPSEPVFLYGVKAKEFEALLDILYAPLYASECLPENTYLLALPLCLKWEFDSPKTHMLSHLEKTTDAVRRYALARELKIPEWERSCLIELIVRQGALTIDEGRRLGIEAVIFVSSLRENQRSRGQYPHICAVCGPDSDTGERGVGMSFVREQVDEWLARSK